MSNPVAMMTTSFAGGGAERSALLTAASWSRPDEVVLLTCLANGPYLSTVPETLKTIDIGVWPRPRHLLAFARSLNAVIVSGKIHVVIANGYGLTQMVLLAQALRLVRRTRVVVVERSTFSLELRDRFPTTLARWAFLRLTRGLYRRADAIVGISDGVARDLERTLRLPATSVATIYNPIDAERIAEAVGEVVPESLERTFTALPRPIIITAGRLVRAKAHHDLIEAFAQFCEDRRGTLVILGEGPLRKHLERQADLLGIQDRVWMPGFVDNPWWFIARSEVFALSSRWEGFGRVIVEALACGIPVVSTDCPSGPREILEGIPRARLTPVADTKALSEAFVELLAERSGIDMGPIDLSAYGPACVASQYEAIVERIHAMRGRRPFGRLPCARSYQERLSAWTGLALKCQLVQRLRRP